MGRLRGCGAQTTISTLAWAKLEAASSWSSLVVALVTCACPEQ